MIASRYSGLEPHGSVAAGQHILLDAEGGNEEAVDHVLRGHDELHVLSGRNVEFIDLTLAFDVLNLLHPLFSDHIHFGCVGGRSALLKINDCAPDKKSNHYKEWKNRPSDFEERGPFDWMGLAAGNATVLNGRHRDHNKDERRHDARDQEEIDEERIHLPCHGRGLIGPQW